MFSRWKPITVAILKVSENYNELAAGLQDILQEAKDLEIVTVDTIWEVTGNS